MQNAKIFVLKLSVLLLISLFARAQSATEKTLYSFTGGADGGTPFSGVVFGPDGRLYGTTNFAGTVNDYCLPGCGTAFRLTPGNGGTWTFDLIHSFAGGTSDFGHPQARLAFDSSGNVWGTAFEWGPGGFGGVFELADNSWDETLVLSLDSSTGTQPSAGLTAYNGNWYGTTQYGRGFVNNGQVFSLTPGTDGQWNETVVHAFSAGADGYEPQTDLAIDGKGNLYGSTPYGGPNGAGDLFELTSIGGRWKEQIIYDFPFYVLGGSYMPNDLILDSKGNLYGTTAFGGTGGTGTCSDLGCGTVFQLERVGNGNSWQENVLYEFQGGTDGEVPRAGLLMDSQGNLYGTTQNGGNDTCPTSQFGGCGTVFELSKATGSWQKTTLYNFTGGADGEFPQGTLVSDSEGNLYGTTVTGNSIPGGYGVVFEITP